jgi:hypothetical protein
VEDCLTGSHTGHQERNVSQKSNVERLEEAGILKSEHFNDHDKKAIESISAEEIEVLVRLRKKLGEAPAGKEHMRPNFPV